MFRILFAGLIVFGLAACTTQSQRHWWDSITGDTQALTQFDFNWQLAGDSALAPLQVFDDGNSTWLQYPAGQASPALFERGPGGDRLLFPRRENDFLVINSVPAQIIMRGGLQSARANKIAAGTPAEQAREAAGAVAQPLLVQAGKSGPAQGRNKSGNVQPTPPKPIADAAIGHRNTPIQAKPLRVISKNFQVSPADGNIRQALARWAKSAGWTFGLEHWAVDVDIPLAGSASFGDEFRPAVRELLAATELSERPLQPCFYSNRVLRVIPLAQRCDRTQNSGEQA